MNGTTYFIVGFVTALIICIVLPSIPRVLNEAIAKIKTEQIELKKQQETLETNENK